MSRTSSDPLLSDELRSQLCGTESDLIVLPESHKNKPKAQKKSRLEEAIEQYKPRPDKAVPSRKKDQRLAEEVKAVLKERKRVQQLQEKQQQELVKRQKRAELYERLKKSALPTQVRDELKTSSDLAKPITTIERQVGKVGERQRRKTKRKRSGSHAGSGARVIVAERSDDDDSDISSASEEVEVSKTALMDGQGSKDEDEEEETGLPIPPTPPPPSEVMATTTTVAAAVALKASSKPKPKPKPANEVEMATATPEPVLVVRPDRPVEMIEARQALPVCAMEQEIIETIKANSVVFVCGETGSGKTTQIPQMLLEAGFGCEASKDYPGQICVSQPRRVAATSVAERVGQELGCPVIRNVAKTPSRGNRYGLFASDLKGCVGFQIRHDADTVSPDCTRMKFCTDGILLRECKEDFLLRQYSCIVMDEVHERGLNSDLLLGLLSRVIPLREQMFREGHTKIKPLKLVIMSATMDLADFQRLGFQSAPVIKIETRQHPVIPHFAKRTEQVDYLQATLKKCCAVHEKLPSGGVLVFLPGQREIEWFCRQLNDRYNNDNEDSDEELQEDAGQSEGNTTKASKAAIHDLDLVGLGEEDGDGEEDQTEADRSSASDDDDDDGYISLSPSKKSKRNGNPALSSIKSVGKIDEKANENVEEQDFSDLGDEDEDDEDGDAYVKFDQRHSKKLRPPPTLKQRVHVVPLYSRLSAVRQRQAFLPPKDPSARVIVVATNVAETSLTIPGVRYVVDSGREKRRVYDQRTGTSGFRVEWISQSSANQRMGRAGRTGPGHCYRLYSSAVYNDVFTPKTPPEMATVPIDDLILYMKSMGIDRVQDFPFPTALDRHAVAAALTRLKQLGVLDGKDQVTPLGSSVSRLPTTVRIGKMLVVAGAEPRFHAILSHLIALGALLSLPSPFDSQQPAQIWRGEGTSDALALLRAAGAYSHSPTESFCAKHRLNIKTMREFEHLYSQLARALCKLLAETKVAIPKNLGRFGPLKPFSLEHESLLRQSVVSGLLDRVAKKMDPIKARAFAKSTSAIFPPRHLRDWPYELSDESTQLPALFLHSHSVLLPPSGNAESNDHTMLPEFLAYTSVSEEGRMESCTALDPAWLRPLCAGTTALCQDQVSETPEPFYDVKQDAVIIHVKPLFGARGWALPLDKVKVSDENKCDDPKFLKAAVPAFARALLEGKVVGKVLEESKSAAPFAHCTRAQLQPRVAVLLARLFKADIVTRADLLKKWREDDTFLKQEIVEHWVRSDEKKQFEEQWRGMVRRALATVKPSS